MSDQVLEAPASRVVQRRKLKTTIVTTVRHNIGDDFVREGIVHLLQSVDAVGDVELIHKHSPVTAVYGRESLRDLRLSKLSEPVLRLMGARNRITDAELLVQSGAPVYWCHPGGPHCAENEWYDPLIRKRFMPDRRGRRFINIAGGSCQRYHSGGEELDACPQCLAYIREFFDACDLTLLRDGLAKKMLNKAGRDADVLPCSSIFARDRFNIEPEPGEYIVLNFIENGGPYKFGQDIDAAEWRAQFARLAREVSRMGRVVLACHNVEEERYAQALVPELERFIVPNEHEPFMRFYARAKWGIMNRVHGAFMMASFGKPAVVVGTDSRARMIENLDLPSYFVNDVKRVGIERLIEDVRSREASYAEEMDAIRKATRAAYESRLRAVLTP